MSNTNRYISSNAVSTTSSTAIIERCIDTVANKNVVLKKFKQKDQYEKELSINKLIKGVSMVHMIDNDDENQTIVFEDGGYELYHRIQEKTMNEQEAIKYFKNIFISLRDLHKNNIFHGDIKLENIVYNEKEDKFNLIDLGLAEILNKGQESESNYGTCWYIAPETIKNNKHTLKSDVYALGITLFACLTGELPFDCSTVMEYVANQLNGEPYIESLEKAEISEKMINLIKKMLEKDPDQRFDADQCVKYLYENN